MLGQALDQALGDRSGHHPLRDGDDPDGRGARDLQHRHLRSSVRRLRATAGCTPGPIGDFDSELTEEFLRALRQQLRT